MATTESVGLAYTRAVWALRQLAMEADSFGPCSEQSRARDALEALGEDREFVASEAEDLTDDGPNWPSLRY